MEKRKLTRRKDDAIIAGVCSGIARYFEVDVTIVRIIFVILAIWGGAGLLFYIIAAILMPSDDERNDATESRDDLSNHDSKKKDLSNKQVASNQLFGIIIMILGVLLLLRNLFDWIRIERFWPIILIVFGLVLLIPKDDKKG